MDPEMMAFLDEIDKRFAARCDSLVRKIDALSLRVGAPKQIDGEVVADSCGGLPEGEPAVLVEGAPTSILRRHSTEYISTDASSAYLTSSGQIHINNGLTSTNSVSSVCFTPAPLASTAVALQEFESLGIKGVQINSADELVAPLPGSAGKVAATVELSVEQEKRARDLLVVDPSAPHLPWRAPLRLRAPPRPPWLRQPRRAPPRRRGRPPRLPGRGCRHRLRARARPRTRAPRVRLRHQQRRAPHAREVGERVCAQAPRRAEEEHAEEYKLCFRSDVFRPLHNAGVATNALATPRASPTRCSTMGRSHDVVVVIDTMGRSSVHSFCIDVTDAVPAGTLARLTGLACLDFAHAARATGAAELCATTHAEAQHHCIHPYKAPARQREPDFWAWDAEAERATKLDCAVFTELVVATDESAGRIFSEYKCGKMFRGKCVVGGSCGNSSMGICVLQTMVSGVLLSSEEGRMVSVNLHCYRVPMVVLLLMPATLAMERKAVEEEANLALEEPSFRGVLLCISCLADWMPTKCSTQVCNSLERRLSASIAVSILGKPDQMLKRYISDFIHAYSIGVDMFYLASEIHGIQRVFGTWISQCPVQFWPFSALLIVKVPWSPFMLLEIKGEAVHPRLLPWLFFSGFAATVQSCKKLVPQPPWMSFDPDPWSKFECCYCHKFDSLQHAAGNGRDGSVDIGNLSADVEKGFLVILGLDLVDAQHRPPWPPPTQHEILSDGVHYDFNLQCWEECIRKPGNASARDDKFLFLKHPWPPPNVCVSKSRGIDQWWIPWSSLECHQGVIWVPFQKLIVSSQHTPDVPSHSDLIFRLYRLQMVVASPLAEFCVQSCLFAGGWIWRTGHRRIDVIFLYELALANMASSLGSMAAMWASRQAGAVVLLQRYRAASGEQVMQAPPRLLLHAQRQRGGRAVFPPGAGHGLWLRGLYQCSA